MALPTDLTLAEVNTAIRDILTAGQSYVRPDVTLQRAQLRDLMALRSQMTVENRANQSGGRHFVSDFSGITKGDSF